MKDLIELLLQLPIPKLSEKQMQDIKQFRSGKKFKYNKELKHNKKNVPAPDSYDIFLQAEAKYQAQDRELTQAIKMTLLPGGYLGFIFSRCKVGYGGDSLQPALLEILPSDKYVLQQLLPRLEKASEYNALFNMGNHTMNMFIAHLYNSVMLKLEMLDPNFKEQGDETVVNTFKIIIKENNISAENQLTKKQIEDAAKKILPNQNPDDKQYKNLLFEIVHRVLDEQDMMRISKAYKDPSELLLYQLKYQCDILFNDIAGKAIEFIKEKYPDLYTSNYAAAEKKDTSVIEEILENFKIDSSSLPEDATLSLFVSKISTLFDLQSCFSSNTKSTDVMDNFNKIYRDKKGILLNSANEENLESLREINLHINEFDRLTRRYEKDILSIISECNKYLENLEKEVAKRHGQFLNRDSFESLYMSPLDLIKKPPKDFRPSKSTQLLLDKYAAVTDLRKTLKTNGDPINNIMTFEIKLRKNLGLFMKNIDSPTKRFLNAIGALLHIDFLQSRTEKDKKAFIEGVASTLFANSKPTVKSIPAVDKPRRTREPK